MFPGIGYIGPDMSYFTARHYWEVGATDPGLATGWLGRYLDVAGDRTNPLQGLSLDGQLNPTLATASQPVGALLAPQAFNLWLPGTDILDMTLNAAISLGRAQLNSRDPGIA